MSTAANETVFDEFARRVNAGDAIELIGGEIVHKAQPLPAHGKVQFKLGELIAGYNRKAGGPRGPGGWWLMAEVEVLYDSGNIFRHDVLGFRMDRHPECPAGMPVRALPDWVCEILSPSTARYDQGQKQRTMHAAGVAHYWILNPEHQTLRVLRRSEAAYLDVLSAGVGEVARAEPFEGVELNVAELFGRDE